MARFEGTSEFDRIFGTDNNDIISGLAGDDLLYGGLGNDVIRGGLGNDQLNASDYTGGTNQEKNYLQGGDGNDILYGSIGRDVLFGGEDSDQMFGGAGDDRLDISGGLDLAVGGEGADFFSFDPYTRDGGERDTLGGTIGDFNPEEGDVLKIIGLAFFDYGSYLRVEGDNLEITHYRGLGVDFNIYGVGEEITAAGGIDAAIAAGFLIINGGSSQSSLATFGEYDMATVSNSMPLLGTDPAFLF